ncbi:PLP-dependent transferase [Sistotremastrum suecicum HHB10207 ss-3]|uniref:PLP-dependent transferase n=1 Tax=Sistotremastrum suecicum HHB10207 ss-3 TaxID=1314776 RepID=A0A165ZTS9_9AGAM|nr:PLP-dependent transferase [Sistotremastrum suecicum HHB10207 ss-3]
MTLDIQSVRSQFPGLKDGFIFGDNAGGSQVVEDVIARISDYLSTSNVQLGAQYTVSKLSTARVDLGATYTAALVNASPTEIIFGPSSTALVISISRAIDKDILDGEEIIITGEHESNVGPWKKLVAARKNIEMKIWPHTPISDSSSNPYAVALQIDALLPLITSKTRLIAFPAASNLLGADGHVKEVIAKAREVAKERGARKLEFIVDCVAYTPHRLINVKDWDVDYAFFSYYKLYGPHVATMYVRQAALQGSLSSLAHHFLPVAGKAYMLQPGGPGYESVYAITGVLPYLLSLSDSKPSIAFDEATATITNTSEITSALVEAYQKIAKHETEVLVTPLIKYLRSKYEQGVRIVGDDAFPVNPGRFPTISFVVVGTKEPAGDKIVKYLDATEKIGIRNGHMYAYTLVESLKPAIDLDDGVVRVSFIHYNTAEEVEIFIEELDRAIDGAVS